MFCNPVPVLFHIRNAQIKSFLYNGVARCPRCGCVHTQDEMFTDLSVFLCESCFLDVVDFTEENFSNWYAFVALRVLCPSANI